MAKKTTSGKSKAGAKSPARKSARRSSRASGLGSTQLSLNRLDETSTPSDEPATNLLTHLQRPLTSADLEKVRDVEGFPLGTDEDIIALSDPPYYTACPNPFLEDFVRAYGKPYDEATDTYHREPFAADVSEGKSDSIYTAHSYHTKVPHKAIMRYILHYTQPGDIVFDGFCGTGMTGVAAQTCGKPDPDFRTMINAQMPSTKWGARRAVLCDLSPAATFIAYNYDTPAGRAIFEREARRILAEIDEELGWMYETLHTDGKTKGYINYTVWSDVFTCPECGKELVFWDVAVINGKVQDDFDCPHCSAKLSKDDLDRAMETVWDPTLRQHQQRGRQIPAVINYGLSRSSRGTTKYDKRPSASDLELIKRIGQTEPAHWYPVDRIDRDIDLWYERDYRQLGIYSIDAFYTKRNLTMVSTLYEKVREVADKRTRLLLTCWVQSVVMGFSKLNRYRVDGFSQVNQLLSGTLYVGATQAEISPWYALEGKIGRIVQMASGAKADHCIITTQSAGAVSLPDNSLDYIFTDPPFGSNIIYSDLSIVWEAWLRLFTNTNQEAVVHRRKKTGNTMDQYRAMMTQAFEKMHHALKPGRWMTVEFHNTQNSVWNAIQEAITAAGFVVADVRTIDKQVGTFKQVTTTSAAKQDLIISAYKPRSAFERRFAKTAGTMDGAWDFVRQHLAQLPVYVEKGGAVEVVAERQNYLLFDRMVAYHIQRGFSVPYSAAEFYAGLRQRHPERDGMYYLAEQVAEYDAKRALAAQVEQLPLFVNDEKSAVQWLRVQLEREPQTRQDLQPQFLQELHQARHEQLPELSQLLTENFLQDPVDRWYVPDPGREEDLEKLRERGLLREFESYQASKGKLKTFRTEAVRAGFKVAWGQRDYAAIIEIARRLPEDVLQEDPALLMYYDNAMMRQGS